jgi:hypothetical protein
MLPCRVLYTGNPPQRGENMKKGENVKERGKTMSKWEVKGKINLKQGRIKVKTWHDSNRKTSYRNRGKKFVGKGKGHKYRFRTEIKTCCFHEKVP